MTERVWETMNKIKVIALFGKSAAGKDSILNWMESQYPQFNKIVSCTTRPKRDYEEDKKDYYFLTDVEFGERVVNGEMLEATSFNGWFYGTSLEALKEDTINIGVFNIAGINCLASDPRIDLFPVYVWANDKTRLLRSLNREADPDCTEICRRFFTDKDDFQEENIEFEFFFLSNETHFDQEDLVGAIDAFAQND